jgi:hypothetical protein
MFRATPRNAKASSRRCRRFLRPWRQRRTWGKRTRPAGQFRLLQGSTQRPGAPAQKNPRSRRSALRLRHPHAHPAAAHPGLRAGSALPGRTRLFLSEGNPPMRCLPQILPRFPSSLLQFPLVLPDRNAYKLIPCASTRTVINRRTSRYTLCCPDPTSRRAPWTC